MKELLRAAWRARQRAVKRVSQLVICWAVQWAALRARHWVEKLAILTAVLMAAQSDAQ